MPSYHDSNDTCDKTCWFGRPPFHNVFDLKADSDTLQHSSHRDHDAAPMFKLDPKDIFKEKYNLYKRIFRERILVKEDNQRILDRTIESKTGKQATAVTIYLPTSFSKKEKKNSDETNNDKLRGVCLHCHGGGWIFGDSRYQCGPRLLQMSDELNIAIVSVDYRLGPSNRYPAAKDDIRTVAEWLISDDARNEFGTDILVGSGESAGAQLLLLAAIDLLQEEKLDAVSIADSIRKNERTYSDSGRRPLFQCLNLVYGVYDLSGSPSVRNDGEKSAPINGNELLWMIDQHLPETITDRKSPSVSPLYTKDLSGMPPALFSVGTNDPLIDDTLLMASRYGSEGCDAHLAIYAGGQHGIGHFGVQENIPLGVKARQHTYEFIERYLS